ncbi:type VI secretion protein IcmF/TssM N-terminal domain-containing protein [Marinicellulosiphila megalodicopiae]|uniref:type VI secretion protein IcmF/TssM N-terminal domain-containing protein n=1 Tax=Marinicellulosiphila megalodicopiae TaxID=2724896 RepID=UPI003BB00704
MFKKILKFILYTLLYAVIAVALIALFLFLIFPGDLNKSLIATGFIFAVVISVVLLRKLYIRLKARAQVRRLVQEEKPEDIDELGMSSSELIKDLKKGWKTAIKGIKKSNLKLEGDAVYVLPWYMVIGKPRSGKSTALKNAKLLMPDIDLPKQEDGSTLNLDWWLYEQAIVLDTAGRYAVPDNSKRDKKEWSALLGMLSRHKQKEPINGVVLVIAADRLLNNTEDQLMEEGRQVRASINELMEQLEVKVPVYLMITKCDLIEGFDVWSEHLPTESKNQAMGYLHEGSSINLDSVIDNVLSKVLDRVKELRLIMIERSELKGNELLILPNKIEKIREGLHHFIGSALKENPYQDTPNFRGLFFSSSQKVEDKSGKLTNRSLFLHEFFTKVLPTDRGLLDSLPSAVRTWRTTKRYWISVMGGVGAIALVLISGLYIKDMSALSEIKSRYQLIELTHAKQKNSSGNTIKTEKDINQKIVALYSLRSLILDLQNAQKDWIIPWDTINLTNSKNTDDLIAMYNQTFKEEVIDAVDTNIDALIRASLGDKTSKVAGGIIRRINLLSAEIGNKTKQHNVDLDEKPGIASNFISTAYDEVDYGNSELFNELYLSYLQWNTLTLDLEDQRRTLQSAFRLLVDRNLGNYDWIIDWANQQGYEKFALNNFWSGTVKVENPPIIEAAYTLEGKAFIDEFLNELSESDDQDMDFTDIKSDFNDFYNIKYSKAWVTFGERFDEGKGQIRDKKEWISVIGSLSTKDNPYFKFIKTMNTQMAHISESIGYDGQSHFSFFQEVVDASGLEATEAADNKALTKLGTKLVGKVCKACKKAIKVGKKVSKATKGGKSIDTDKIIDASVVELEAYNKALYDTSFNAESKSQSYSTISTLFTTPDNPGSGDNSMATAYNSIVNFQKLIGKPGANDRLFWELYKGPLGVIYDYMEEENNCYLQEQWNTEVLAQIEDVEEKKLGVFLIGETGLLWDFINGTAAPYLQKKKDKGYIPTQVNTDRQVPWDKEFLGYVNDASAGKTLVGNEFKVKISTIPTGVNQSAAIAPYATFLELHCGDTQQSLANYNYTTAAEFTWSLENCGDTTLQIDIGHISLRKLYKEEDGGFSLFLQDFKDGRHTFGAADFPAQESLLRKESVTAIDVKYQFENHQPVLRVLDDVPLTPPQRVTQCWPTDSESES